MTTAQTWRFFEAMTMVIRAGFVSQRVEDNKDRYDGSSSYSGLLCSIGSVLDGIASIRVDHPSPVHLHAWT